MRILIATTILFLLGACAHVRTASDDTLFDSIDVNHDGSLSLEEMAAQREREREARREARRQRMFDRADTDNNGEISPAEFEAMGNQRFARMDKNGDGSVAPDEIRRGRHHRGGCGGYGGPGGPKPF